MCASCSRSLVSLRMGSASTDSSPSQLPKLCLRFASSMVMIWEQNEQVNIKEKSKTQRLHCWCKTGSGCFTSQLQDAGSLKKLSIMSSSSFSTTTKPCSRASFPYTSGDHWTKNAYRASTLEHTHSLFDWFKAHCQLTHIAFKSSLSFFFSHSFIYWHF